MATVILQPQGKKRALESIREGSTIPSILRMNTINNSSMASDTVMERTIIWGTHADYARSTNGLPVKTAAKNSEYEGALLFPIAASRRFSNMTLHFNDSYKTLGLTFLLKGAESAQANRYGGAAKLVGSITIRF